MNKILCIDDTPDEFIGSKSTLRNILVHTLNNSTYKMVFVKTGTEGIKAAAADKYIKLVLLDVRFNGKIEGPAIADSLLEKAPHVKVIVLTSVDDKGNKISFGWKPNVVHYVLKKDIANINTQMKLKNICLAIAGDYENINWEIGFSDNSDVITLNKKKTGESFGIDVPMTAKPALLKCMESPNRPVDLPTEEFGKNLNKVHNMINEKVLEGTNWNTWGILSREGCAKGQLKLIVGSVVPSSLINSGDNSFISRIEFDALKKEVMKRLDRIEKLLLSKKKK